MARKPNLIERVEWLEARYTQLLERCEHNEKEIAELRLRHDQLIQEIHQWITR